MDRRRISTGKAPELSRSIRLGRRICEGAGARDPIDDIRVGLGGQGVIAAVRRHNPPVIFDWLIDALSYQGVSDSIAYGYMEQHGRIRWQDIAATLADQPSCPNLTGF